MGTVVTDFGAEPVAEVDSASAELLFNSSSWQARLDQARVTREKILAERALNGEARLDNMSGPRPWEKTARKAPGADAPAAQPEDLAERRRLRTLALMEGQMLPATAPMAEAVFRSSGAVHLKPVAAALPAATALPVTPPTEVQAAVLPRQIAGIGVRSVLIGVAFAFGLGIGLGAVLIPSLVAAPPAPPDVAMAAPAVPASAPVAAPPAALDPGSPIVDLSAAMPRVRPAAPEVLGAVQQSLGRPAVAGAAPVIPAVSIPPVRVAEPARITPVGRADVAAGLTDRNPARPVVLTVFTSPVAGTAALTAIAYPQAGGVAPVAQEATATLALPLDAGGDALPGLVSIAPAAAPTMTPANPYAGITVRILAPAGTSDAEMTRLEGKLTQAGFSPDAAKPTTFKVSQTHIRFYHDADAQAAGAIAASMDAEARDFTTAGSALPAGTIELWVSGNPATAEAAPAKKKAAKAKKTARKVAAVQQPSGQSKIQALRDRLAAKMKNGDHL